MTWFQPNSFTKRTFKCTQLDTVSTGVYAHSTMFWAFPVTISTGKDIRILYLSIHQGPNTHSWCSGNLNVENSTSRQQPLTNGVLAEVYVHLRNNSTCNYVEMWTQATLRKRLAGLSVEKPSTLKRRTGRRDSSSNQPRFLVCLTNEMRVQIVLPASL